MAYSVLFLVGCLLFLVGIIGAFVHNAELILIGFIAGILFVFLDFAVVYGSSDEIDEGGDSAKGI
jgi:hypothetical protein